MKVNVIEQIERKDLALKFSTNAMIDFFDSVKKFCWCVLKLAQYACQAWSNVIIVGILDLSAWMSFQGKLFGGERTCT